jgi:hypothetical protein
VARGAISSEGSSGENIQHFSTIRIRASGVGNLLMAVNALDFTREKALAPLFLHRSNRIQPNRIVNFVEQRASFSFRTLEIDEYIRINRIVVYMKEIYTSHPGA